MNLNVISDVPDFFWAKYSGYNFNDGLKVIFTSNPIPADFHLVYGKYVEFDFKVSKSKVWFYCSEPPEIHKFRRSYLSQFGLIVGPQFDYLKKKTNYLNTFSVYPLHIGQPIDDLYTKSRLTFQSISGLMSPSINAVSIIMSDKKITQTQRDRINFLEEIRGELHQVLNVFGRQSNPVNDKLEVLSKYRYHIAIENANHEDYFTEKLTDAIVSRNIVFYSGASNIHNYFDPKSIIPIDIKNIPESIRIILDTVLDDDYYSQSVESINGNISKVMNDFTIFSLGNYLVKFSKQIDRTQNDYIKLSSRLSTLDKMELFLRKVFEKSTLFK